MNLTVIVLVSVLVFLIAYDVYTLKARGVRSTISVTLYLGAQRYPILAFGLGVLVGHLFWSQG